jgi:hypothetical protein
MKRVLLPWKYLIDGLMSRFVYIPRFIFISLDFYSLYYFSVSHDRFFALSPLTPPPFLPAPTLLLGEMLACVLYFLYPQFLSPYFKWPDLKHLKPHSITPTCPPPPFQGDGIGLLETRRGLSGVMLLGYQYDIQAAGIARNS